MVMSSIKVLEGGSVRCSFFITPFDVFAAPRNMSSIARTKRSEEITQAIMMPISSACHLVQSLTVNFMKAALKYFIMISPTLLGKLENSRTIRIKWCGTEPYAVAKSNQITCTSVLSPLAESIVTWYATERGKGRSIPLTFCV